MKSTLNGKAVTNEIDWGKVQLVQSNDCSIVILTNGEHTNNYFSGTVLQIDDISTYEVGKFYEREFNLNGYFVLPSSQSITLQND